MEEPAFNLKPYCYETDGGTYNDDTKYFINNIFSKSGVCYSTKVPTNANIQIYLGRAIEVEPVNVPPKDYKVKGDANHIVLPFEKHVADPDEEETFKLLDEFEMLNQGSGYTCFVKSFALFTSDRETKLAKSPIVKLFDNISSVEQFEALKLPIKKVTKIPDSTASVAYEIDLSNT